MRLNMKLVFYISMSLCAAKIPPHIIFIVADDLGWNDVGWHNPSMHTPNLDKLAKNGVILDSSYVERICTPTRNCFMTGLYPFHTGLQHSVIEPLEPRALPSQFVTLPEKLKPLGYSTHIVGKWHLGYCNWKYTPTYRGFDSFFGFYTGSQNYYSHHNEMGYDFRFNEDIYQDRSRTYSPKLFSNRVVEIVNGMDPLKHPLYLYIAFQSVHGPLQVPKRYKNLYKVAFGKRKTYCGMVSALDEAVGTITNALESKGFMDNAIIVFTTDNGGKPTRGGSNYPLYGHKGTLFEGGTRGVAFVYSPSFLKKSKYVNNEMIHAVDWFPTLLHVAGGKPDHSLDGVNQWKTISEGERSSREEFVYGLDDVQGRWAFRFRNYKLIFGETHTDDQWKEIRLFDLENDPNEQEDIAEQHIDVVESLKQMFKLHHDTQVSYNFADNKLIANPRTISNGTLSPGWC